MTEEIKRSKQEQYKEDSQYLKGDLIEELADQTTPFVSDASYELLKFHGSYQGYDRDTATERKKAGLEKEWEFMVRMTCPGGRLSADQYLALDTICEDYANASLRITTRQTFQFHSIIKSNLKGHIAALNEQLLSTLGGCGDVVRNVMCTSAPYKTAKHARLLEDTRRVAKFCAPKTQAYHEIWLDGKNVVQAPDQEVEPLYGKHYLPRKFKISLSTPEDNSMDALTHDLAIIFIYNEQDELLGYNLCLGGGLGMTHNKPATYPRLATPIAFVAADDLLRGVEAVIKLTRDHADRANRKHARLKYVVEENGIEWTRKTLESYYGEAMQDPAPMGEFLVPDHMGWHEQGDGKLFVGVPVDSGRIIDNDDTKIRSAVKAVVEKYRPEVILTPDQNIIFADVAPEDRDAITDLLRSFDIKLREDISEAHRYFLACVALPTCGKALAEAERVKLPLVASIEKVMQKHNIADDRIAIRIAGCPNGCSRPYVGDIGIVGRTPGHYALFIGGDFEGTRLNEKVFDKVPYENIEDVLDILFASYVAERQSEQEGFGDYTFRVGNRKVAGAVEEQLGQEHKWAKVA
jgi:sulfite reductase (ferredoxin)